MSKLQKRLLPKGKFELTMMLFRIFKDRKYNT